MIAPMLAGVVYFSAMSDFVHLLHDCNVKRVYFHSFWARVYRDESRLGDYKVGDRKTRFVDCHCLSGLTSFANAFKIVVNGGDALEAVDADLTANRNRIGAAFRKAWQPGKGGKIRLIVGQVIDDRPPRSVWVPVDDFLAGTIPTEFFVVDYIQAGESE